MPNFRRSKRSTESATATRTSEAGAERAGPGKSQSKPQLLDLKTALRELHRSRRGITGLTLRILTVNVIPLLVLGMGILYLGQYRDSLVNAELQTLKARTQLFAGAIAEGAIRPVVTAVAPGVPITGEESEALISDLSGRMVKRMAETTDSRTQLFDSGGALIADSHQMTPHGQPPETAAGGEEAVSDFLSLPGFLKQIGQRIIETILVNMDLPAYPQALSGSAQAYPDARAALEGNVSATAWKHPKGGIILSAAAPVQKVKKVLGVVHLTRDGKDIERALSRVRIDLLRLFFGAMLMTFMLSIYLSSAIGKPLRRLAGAAETVRLGKGRTTEIPDMSRRNDEIGDLSVALRDMTQALGERMDMIERFAADVAHEIKNPLTSLRSAVETAGRVQDQAQRDKLMEIIKNDVQRLDRLISDISNASRLDAELSREELEIVDLKALLLALADAYRKPLDRTGGQDDPALHSDTAQNARVRLDLPNIRQIMVNGVESRLAQVFQNLIGNALSFSPPEGVVTIRAEIRKDYVSVHVDDQGPGIPESKLSTVFDRFYSERPKHEDYGSHSGLGLSIARQIITAHRGKIFAQNLRDDDNKIAGARFTVILGTV